MDCCFGTSSLLLQPLTEEVHRIMVLCYFLMEIDVCIGARQSTVELEICTQEIKSANEAALSLETHHTVVVHAARCGMRHAGI